MMAGLRLTEKDLAHVLRRAQELDGQLPESLHSRPDIQGAIDAMVEAGISREAALQALQERLAESVALPQEEETYQVGDIVFCSDGKWFSLAKVKEKRGERLRVRLMAGTDAEFKIQDVKPFIPTSGTKVSVPYSGMWVDAEVMGFNPDALTLQCSYWGSNLNISLDQVRIRDTRHEPPIKAKLVQYATWGAWFLGGTAAGMILMRIMMR